MLIDSYFLIVIFTICVLGEQLLRLSKDSKSILVKIVGIFFYITLIMSFVSVIVDSNHLKIIFVTLSVFSLVYNATVLPIDENYLIQYTSDQKSNESALVENDKREEIDADLEEKAILEKVHHFFITTQKYLDSDFDLDILECELNIPRKKISQAINHQTGDNFYRFIAKYRIAFAKQLIVTHSNYSFDYLCNISGFSSKSSFNRYFKDFVGITPKEYKMMLN